MLQIIRPELKHLKEIVALTRTTMFGEESSEHKLHEFLKSQLANLTTFFQIIEDNGVVKGVVTANLQRQVWDDKVVGYVGIIAGKDGYDKHLETIKNNLIAWAKENEAKQVIFVTVGIKDNIDGMPKEFKHLGSMYGVEL